MRESLLSLFNFLAKEDLLPDDFLNTVSKSIQNSWRTFSAGRTNCYPCLDSKKKKI